MLVSKSDQTSVGFPRNLSDAEFFLFRANHAAFVVRVPCAPLGIFMANSTNIRTSSLRGMFHAAILRAKIPSPMRFSGTHIAIYI